MDFMTAASLVISGEAFGKDSTPESVNEIRQAIANVSDLIGQVQSRFDQHLKGVRMNGTKVIRRDYLPGVDFFRNPKGWSDVKTAEDGADVLAGLQNLLNAKAGK